MADTLRDSSATAASSSSDDGATRAELEEQRAFLLTSLADLEAERAAGDIDDADYAALKDDYTARAAAVIRALDADTAAPAVAAPAPASPARRMRLLAGVAFVALIAVASGLLLARSAGERLPGDQVTGEIELGANDKLIRAQQLVSQGEVLEAVQLYDEILAEDPEQPVALAQRGWLITRAGLVEEGLVYLDRAIAVAPRYAEARFFRARVKMEQGDPQAAIADYEAFLAADPPEEFRALVERDLQLARDAAAGIGPVAPPVPVDPSTTTTAP